MPQINEISWSQLSLSFVLLLLFNSLFINFMMNFNSSLFSFSNRLVSLISFDSM